MTSQPGKKRVTSCLDREQEKEVSLEQGPRLLAQGEVTNMNK